jgi:hypothetical protein
LLVQEHQDQAAEVKEWCNPDRFAETSQCPWCSNNPRNYAVFAESYIDMILELRAEIDAFLHIAPAPPETAPTGDHGTTGGEPVAPAADAGAVAVAGTPEAIS